MAEDAPVVMLASGTRGDVQPFLALALGLRRAGIRVVIAAAPRFRSLVEDRDVGFAALEGNPSDLMARSSGSMAASLRGGAARGVIATARYLHAAQAEYRRMLESAAAACGIPAAAGGSGTAACVPARAVILGLSSTWGLSIAEALGVPVIPCMMQPFGRTRTFPSALLPLRLSMGPRYNALSYRVVEQAMWLPWRRTTNEWRRRTLGLPPLPAAGPWRKLYATGFPCLYGFSPAVVAAPSDWPAGHVVTGYWFLEETAGWSPPPALERFLGQGDRPLYVGFGSMGMQGAGGMLRVIERALHLSGLRAVISGSGRHGRSEPPDGESRMFFVEDVPHAWLFPRVAAVMHHGGAGTTADGLRAGVPSIICPTAADQHFWGQRIARLRAGPRPVAPRDLTAAAVAELFVRVAMDEGMRRRTCALGERIRKENGVERAVEALVPLLRGSPHATRSFSRAASTVKQS
jgi:UDP:flavonoid glycosyltransferase YjiC (YdhE family)